MLKWLFHLLITKWDPDFTKVTICERVRINKAEREMISAHKVYGLLPEDQKAEYMALWQEFEEQNTKEAVFCAILDRVQPSMLNKATNFIKYYIRMIKNI